jgi:NAD(P)-dependent dehydrogenase (short-subunit alcohol dehydrogenase family)
MMPGSSAYAAAKGAIEILTRFLAKELVPRGITANVVAPAGPASVEDAGRNPMANAYCEWVIGTIRREGLDYLDLKRSGYRSERSRRPRRQIRGQTSVMASRPIAGSPPLTRNARTRSASMDESHYAPLMGDWRADETSYRFRRRDDHEGREVLSVSTMTR